MWFSLALGHGACLVADSSIGEIRGGGGSTAGDASASDGATAGMGGPALEVWANRDVDILIVVDDSASMATIQAALANAGISLLDLFGAANGSARIAFTTTDNANPRCNGQSADAGNFILSSCRSREADFVNVAAGLDATDQACRDRCPEAWADVALTPTATTQDPTPRARPWIETSGGVSNLPAAMSSADAFGCLAPQGISGCGFVQPLEATYQALTRAQTKGDAAFGFLREHASLQVVIVTDATDCSFNPSHQEIFSPTGDRVFWSNPAARAATPAVCWNAGVSCSGESPQDCVSSDFDAQGTPVNADNADTDAVMRPVSRYIDYLKSIEASKQERWPSSEVRVTVVAGVRDDGSVRYEDSLDDAFSDEFGIGAGCATFGGAAVPPPVRLREFADAFRGGDGHQNMFSVCASDLSRIWSSVAEEVSGVVTPLCMPLCVADVDPSTTTIDARCALWERTPQADGTVLETPVPECIDDSQQANVCYVALSGADRTDLCRESGWNLEFALKRRAGAPLSMGSAITATCEPSEDAAADCPL